MLYKIIVFCVLINSAWSDLGCPNKPPGVHKSSPSPEELKGCKQYSCDSCCTANDSIALGYRPLQTVERWNFTQCNHTLSAACSDAFSQMLCFFKCSPNLYPFFSKSTTDPIPICDWFCDRWFSSCMNDLTCVVRQNWVTGFDPKRINGVDQCRKDSTCRSFKEVYDDGRSMCDTLFGGFFKYTANETKCMDPFTEDHNVEIINNLYPGMETKICNADVYANYIDAGEIVGIVFGVLGGIILILAGLALYRRHKMKENGKDVSKEKGTAQELTTMNAPPKNAPPSANLPKDDSSGEE